MQQFYMHAAGQSIQPQTLKDNHKGHEGAQRNP